MSLLGRMARIEQPRIPGHMFHALFVGVQLGQVDIAEAKMLIQFGATSGEAAQWNWIEGSFSAASNKVKWIQAFESALLLMEQGWHFTLSDVSTLQTEFQAWMTAAQ